MDPSTAETIASGPLSDQIGDALASLSAEHRAVVVLRYLLEYTPGEIGRMLDLPRGTVNSRLRRALDQLAGELEEAQP
jgi:RNA polymerase sigma-70 factor (ECF subfamily)